MRLSGWQRIGVVFSALWLLFVGGLAAIEMLHSAPFGEFVFVEFVRDGTETTQGNVRPITEEEAKQLRPRRPFEGRQEVIESHVDPETGKRTITVASFRAVLRAKHLLITGVAPILSGWFFVYLISWTFKWVKRGFQRG